MDDNVDHVREALRTFQTERELFAIAVYVVDGEHAVRFAAAGAQCGKCDRLHLSSGNIGMVARTGRTHSTADVSADPTYTSCFAEVRAETVVPVLSAGRVVGVIDAESSGGAAIDSSALAALAERLAPFLVRQKGNRKRAKR